MSKYFKPEEFASGDGAPSLYPNVVQDCLIELLDKIIDSYPGEKGVPIGSYLSQYLANFYLSYFDHWLKERISEGERKAIKQMSIDDLISVIMNNAKVTIGSSSKGKK